MGRKRNWTPAPEGFSQPNGSGNGGIETRERVAKVEVILQYVKEQIAQTERQLGDRLTALERTDRETLKTLLDLAPAIQSLTQLEAARQRAIRLVNQTGVLIVIYLAASGHVSEKTIGMLKNILQLAKPFGFG